MPCGRAGLIGADRAAAVAAYREALSTRPRRWAPTPGEPRPGDTDDWERKLDLVVRERVAAVSFTFGLPSAGVLGELRRHGVESVVTVTDVDEARRLSRPASTGSASRARRPAVTAARSTRLRLPDGVRPRRRSSSGCAGSRRRRAEPTSPSWLPAASRPASRPTPCAAPAPMPCRSARRCSSPRRRARAWPTAAPSPTRHTHDTTVTRAFSGRLGRCLETDFVRRHDRAGARRLPGGAPRHGAAATGLGARRPARPRGALGRHGWRSARPVPAATVVAELSALSHPRRRADGHGRGGRDASSDTEAPRRSAGGIRCAACRSAEGNLTWLPAADWPDLLAPPVAAAIDQLRGARVASIDAGARRHGGVLCRLRRRTGGLSELCRGRGAPRRGGDASPRSWSSRPTGPTSTASCGATSGCARSRSPTRRARRRSRGCSRAASRRSGCPRAGPSSSTPASSRQGRSSSGRACAAPSCSCTAQRWPTCRAPWCSTRDR